MTESHQQPKWHQPQPSAESPVLKLYNSLTRSKVPFVPEFGRRVRWYCCGPTVYDASHMGHARSYITFDILRRVLEDYFGYEVLYVMNITDIDDKIIVRARHSYLLRQYSEASPLVDNELLWDVVEAWLVYVKKQLSVTVSWNRSALLQPVYDAWNMFLLQQKEPSTIMNEDPKYTLAVATAKTVYEKVIIPLSTADGERSPRAEIVSLAADVLAPWLDARDGAKLTDPKIFRDLSAYWESSFLQDMKALNVQPPDVMTRVSEYVPEIIAFVQGIMDRGYGYRTEDGSVYFDTQRFHGSEGHHYAKLCPWAAGNVQLLEEGEGSLTKASGKKSPSDFALWKASKPGEPAWNSPWSQGRPGWHIECSAMAGNVMEGTLDIHSGGIDLAFPHHDNEIAQSEAFYNCHQWTHYFLHAGHLHIAGQKMSKSLKNFVTIQEALAQYSARQIRIMFLMHGWNAVLDYQSSSMEAAQSIEQSLIHFFSTVAARVDETRAQWQFTGQHTYQQQEKQLTLQLFKVQDLVHKALCDSIDTPQVIQLLMDLVSQTNIYLSQRKSVDLCVDLVQKIAKYINKILTTFGVEMTSNISTGSSNGDEMAALRAFSSYRDQVRQLARKQADAKQYFALSDWVRDEALLPLGVLLEDREEGEAALVKRIDPAVALQQRQAKAEQEEALQEKKQLALQERQRQQREKLLKGQYPPHLLFIQGSEADQFSQWDDQGIPTHTRDGEPVSKSLRKKMEKQHQQQQSLHEQYLSALAQGILKLE